jgi:hypothetical protein
LNHPDVPFFSIEFQYIPFFSICNQKIQKNSFFFEMERITLELWARKCSKGICVVSRAEWMCLDLAGPLAGKKPPALSEAQTESPGETEDQSEGACQHKHADAEGVSVKGAVSPGLGLQRLTRNNENRLAASVWLSA